MTVGETELLRIVGELLASSRRVDSEDQWQSRKIDDEGWMYSIEMRKALESAHWKLKQSEDIVSVPTIQTKTYIAPVRNDGDHEFCLPSEFSFSEQAAEEQAIRTERACGPSWAKANPIKRYARLEVREIVEGQS